MSKTAAAGNNDGRNAREWSYRERLWVPWWWWPLGLAVAALMAFQVTMGIRSLPSFVPYVALAPVAIAVLAALCRHELLVHPGDDGPSLVVDGSELPLRFIARAAPIEAELTQLALGPRLDPAAFVRHHGWIPGLLVVVLDDPDDPTPYWLISTRHPERLAAALGAKGP